MTNLREAATKYALECGHDECDCNNAFEAGAAWRAERDERLLNAAKQVVACYKDDMFPAANPYAEDRMGELYEAIQQTANDNGGKS